MRFLLTANLLDSGAVVAEVASEHAGAVVTFLGTVRRQSHGKLVVRLEYEAYGSMVLAMFDRIAGEARAQWPGVELAIHHRTGACAVGEPTIAIAAAAPHRADAFAACRHAIDRIKADAPIWKREVYEDGAEWVGCGS